MQKKDEISQSIYSYLESLHQAGGGKGGEGREGGREERGEGREGGREERGGREDIFTQIT